MNKLNIILSPYQVHSLILPDRYEMLSVCINKELLNTYKTSELLNFLSEVLHQFSLNINNSLLINAVNALFENKIQHEVKNAITSSALGFCNKPEDNISLQKQANAASYSLYHYIKLFKQQIGLTPHKFQIQNRIRKAQRLIEDGKNITSIAMDLGFYDQSHFIKYFKHIVGITPSEYQKVFKRLL